MSKRGETPWKSADQNNNNTEQDQMGGSVEDCWEIYRGKKGGERERKAMIRMKDLATLNPEIYNRSILTQYLKSTGKMSRIYGGMDKKCICSKGEVNIGKSINWIVGLR